MVCSTRKRWERLECGIDDIITLAQYNRASRQGATHVVTGITYGATLVTNIIEKQNSFDKNHNTHIGFSASTMTEIAPVFLAQQKFHVEKPRLSQEVRDSCAFKVFGDYSIPEQDNPTTLDGVFQLVKTWPSLVGDGVPVQITVTPLHQFVDDSVEAKILHELEADERAHILTVYDDVHRLAARRAQIQRRLEFGLGNFSACCPTFKDSCRTRMNVADGVLGRSRKALARYLQAYRTQGHEGGGTTTEFLLRVKEGLDPHFSDCTQDESVLDLLHTINTLTAGCKAPFTPLNQLRTMMTQADENPLAVVLIPSSPNLDAVINAYKVVVSEIQRWRVDEDRKAAKTSV